jgi:hypothetical protein
VSLSARNDATSPGTYVLPYKTLLKASNVAELGDEVVVKNDTYSGFKDAYGRFGSTRGNGVADPAENLAEAHQILRVDTDKVLKLLNKSAWHLDQRSVAHNPCP